MVSFFRKGFKQCSDFLLFRKNHQFLFFIFLLPVFFVLHTYNDYFGLLRWDNVLFWLFRYLLLTFIVIMVALLLMQTPQKAFLFSFFCLCIFFFFGAFHDFIKELSIPAFLYSYSFLLSLIGVVVLILIGVLYRTKTDFRKLILATIFFMSISLFIDVVLLGYYGFSQKNNQNSLLAKDRVSFSNEIPVADSLPDIFFLIMDSYTNSTTLLSEFDHNNSSIDSTFAHKGFFVPKNSYSNYYSTALSVASMFDLNYLEGNLENAFLTNKMLAKGVASLDKVCLIPFLESNGYEYLNYGAFRIGGKKPVRATSLAKIADQAIPLQTIWGRINRDIWWAYRYKNIFTGKFTLPLSYIIGKKEQVELSEVNYELFVKELSAKSSSKPRLVYSHLMTTHGPFYFDSLGGFNSDTLIALDKIDNKKGYVDQIKYANTLLKKMINAIDTSSTRPKVVLIFGDHGVRLSDRKKWPIAFSCLSAIYFSDGNYELLSDKLSSVNVFRIVLNKYFNQQLPLLEHRVATPDSIYHDW